MTALTQNTTNTGTSGDDSFTINFGSGTFTTVDGLAGIDTITSLTQSTGFIGSNLQLTSIENLTFGSTSQFWFLTTGALGTTTPIFHITGNNPNAGAGEKNWITFKPSNGATTMDLSGLTFTNFSQSNQIVFADFSLATTGVTITGAIANFTATSGSGDDTVTFIGTGTNSAFLGTGTDTVIGSAAGTNDIITVSGQRANWKVIQLGLHEFELNGAQGNKHVTNVEFALFDDGEFAIADLVGPTHATVTYSNGGTGANLSPLSIILAHETLVVVQHSDSVFKIVQDGPPSDRGYSVEFIGTGFTYTGVNPTPTGGTITGIHVKDNNGTTYIVIDGEFANASLADFWSLLQASNSYNDTKAALDQLIGGDCNQIGSAALDQIQTYGTDGTIDGKGGADQIDIFHKGTTAIGGTGNDYLRPLLQAAGFDADVVLHGGLVNGKVAKDEHNTLAIDVDIFAPSIMDGIDRFIFTGSSPSQQLNVKPTFFGVLGKPAFNLKGLDSTTTNLLDIQRDGTAAVNLNLSKVTVTNFAGANQGVKFLLAEDNANPQNDIVKGVLGAHNFFFFDAGDDQATGGSLADELHGGSGKNVLIGGGGQDQIWGGAEADIFKFNKVGDSKTTLPDQILDFSGFGLEGDKIDLSKIDANTHKLHNQTFKIIGDQAFHHKAGELHFINQGTFVSVEGDVNGDGNADFKIDVHNLSNDLTTLAADDFLM